LKRKSKTVQILNKFVFFLFLCFIFGCCYKPLILRKVPAKRVYFGNLWLEVKFFTNNQTKIFSGYADFQASEDFLFLRFKSPLNTTLGYGKWEISSFNLIEIFDFYSKKHYLVTFQKQPELKNIPLYFMGLKEKTLRWDFLKTSFEYSFSEEKKEGMISSEVFQLRWKIKTLSISQDFKPLLDETSFLKDFSEVEITF